MKKIYAFLRHTPEWAERANCGQYNGYLAIPIEYKDLLLSYDEDWGRDFFVGPSISDVTFLAEGNKLHDDGIFLDEGVSSDVKGKFLIAGFDTCHSWNSWSEYDFEYVKEMTLEWREMVEKYLEKRK